MVKKMGLENRMEYRSLHAMKEFIRLASCRRTPVYYLNENCLKELKELGAAGLDYHMGVIKKHRMDQAAHDLGLTVNVWTVDEVEDMKWLIEQKVDLSPLTNRSSYKKN